MEQGTRSKTDTSGLTQREKDIHQVLQKNELFGGKGADKISHAGTLNSGFSFGPAQWDLARSDQKGINPKRDAFMEILKNHQTANPELNKATLKNIEAAIKTKGNPAALDAKTKGLIDEALSSDSAKAKVADMYQAHLGELDRKTQGVIDAAKPEARKFLDTPEGRRLVADNINQFGTPTKLKEFVSGQGKANFNGKDHMLEGELTFDKWADYVGDYDQFQKRPDILKRRLDTIADLSGKPGWKGFIAAKEREILSRPDKPADAKNETPKSPGADAPSQNGAASEDKGAAETEPPEVRKFREDLLKPNDPADEIMLKRTEQMTKDEASTLTGHRIGMPSGLTRGHDMAEKEFAFIDHFYGNSPGGPIRPIPAQPTAPRVPGGVDLGEALRRVGGRVAQAAAGSRMDGAVRGLQGGLNKLADEVHERDGRAAARTVVPEGVLREDGAFGPKTRLALKQSLVTLGPDRVERALRPFLRF